MTSYVPRAGLIYIVALTTSFAQVLTPAQCRAIRGLKMKMRYLATESPPFFHIAFVSSPSSGADSDGNGYYSLSGAGSGDMAAPSSGIFARVRDSKDSGKLL